MSNEDYTVHLGLYGKKTFAIIRKGLEMVRKPWPISSSHIKQMPNNEVIYCNDGPYGRKYDTPDKKKALRKTLGTLMMKAAKRYHAIHFNDYIDVESPAKVRDYVNKDEILEPECGVTMLKLAFLAEFLWGFKEKKNLSKCYAQDLIDELVSHPIEEFAAAAIGTLEQEILRMEEMKNQALNQLKEEYRQKTQAVENEWNPKIGELNTQIYELRKSL